MESAIAEHGALLTRVCAELPETVPPCGVRPEIRPVIRWDSSLGSEPLRKASWVCSTPAVANCSE